ncbi:Uncharacterized protein APZ42_022081 [Daphnia magna]|uniref:Uncharacterized protein n=1 Tax=Daphnia magna TaxID=35525 RepID=A0A162C8P9_9CRUS|nr:Uncharacterized protein APZ42_022081 [Daphnia magna]
MKFILIALLGLAAIVASQPVDEAAAPDGVPVGGVAVEAEPIHDMEGSEAGLKLIEHKLEHWLKKCYKKGGCGSGLWIWWISCVSIPSSCLHSCLPRRLRNTVCWWLWGIPWQLWQLWKLWKLWRLRRLWRLRWLRWLRRLRIRTIN